MSTEKTLVLVKPDGVARGLVGEVIARIEAKGYKISALRMMQADRALLEKHYAEHQGKPFFEPLVEFMLSGDTVALKVEGHRVIEGFRSLAGATDPTVAAPGTIRGDLGRDWGLKVQQNLVHGSDSPESAARELVEETGWQAGKIELLLIGPTNNGKSMIVEKFRRTHPASSDADQEHIPVLVVQMPSEPSVIRFYVALLAAMGAPLRPRPRLPEMEQLALALLRKVGVRMLVIDELHNVLAGNSVNRREFLNLLRFLGNELRIPLVGVGTRDAYLAIRSDDQLENRFEPMMLPLWEANDDCCSLLASFAASLPLRRPSPIATPDMARYLLTRSEGTIGELAHLLMAAAVAALESGEEAINHRTLSMADYTGPGERRRQFERELM